VIGFRGSGDFEAWSSPEKRPLGRGVVGVLSPLIFEFIFDSPAVDAVEGGLRLTGRKLAAVAVAMM